MSSRSNSRGRSSTVEASSARDSSLAQESLPSSISLISTSNIAVVEQEQPTLVMTSDWIAKVPELLELIVPEAPLVSGTVDPAELSLVGPVVIYHLPSQTGDSTQDTTHSSLCNCRHSSKLSKFFSWTESFVPSSLTPDYSSILSLYLPKYPQWILEMAKVPETPVIPWQSLPYMNDLSHGTLYLNEVVAYLYPGSSLAWHHYVWRTFTNRLITDNERAHDALSRMRIVYATNENLIAENQALESNLAGKSETIAEIEAIHEKTVADLDARHARTIAELKTRHEKEATEVKAQNTSVIREYADKVASLNNDLRVTEEGAMIRISQLDMEIRVSSIEHTVIKKDQAAIISRLEGEIGGVRSMHTQILSVKEDRISQLKKDIKEVRIAKMKDAVTATAKDSRISELEKEIENGRKADTAAAKDVKISQLENEIMELKDIKDTRISQLEKEIEDTRKSDISVETAKDIRISQLEKEIQELKNQLKDVKDTRTSQLERKIEKQAGVKYTRIRQLEKEIKDARIKDTAAAIAKDNKISQLKKEIKDTTTKQATFLKAKDARISQLERQIQDQLAEPQTSSVVEPNSPISEAIEEIDESPAEAKETLMERILKSRMYEIILHIRSTLVVVLCVLIWFVLCQMDSSRSKTLEMTR